jgi:hypothetical protein
MRTATARLVEKRESAWRRLNRTPMRREDAPGDRLSGSSNEERSLPDAWWLEHGAEDRGRPQAEPARELETRGALASRARTADQESPLPARTQGAARPTLTRVLSVVGPPADAVQQPRGKRLQRAQVLSGRSRRRGASCRPETGRRRGSPATRSAQVTTDNSSGSASGTARGSEALFDRNLIHAGGLRCPDAKGRLSDHTNGCGGTLAMAITCPRNVREPACLKAFRSMARSSSLLMDRPLRADNIRYGVAKSQSTRVSSACRRRRGKRPTIC